MDQILSDCDHITSREADVLHLVALGLSAKEIAIKLDISACTVVRHVENVRMKTRTRNRTHMVAYLLNKGLLSIET